MPRAVECHGMAIDQAGVAILYAPERSREFGWLEPKGANSLDVMIRTYWRPTAPTEQYPVIVISRPSATSFGIRSVPVTDATSIVSIADVEEVVPAELTDEEARDAVLQYVESNPGVDACDIAEALRLPILRVFAIADVLIDEGEIEVPESRP